MSVNLSINYREINALKALRVVKVVLMKIRFEIQYRNMLINDGPYDKRLFFYHNLPFIIVHF